MPTATAIAGPNRLSRLRLAWLLLAAAGVPLSLLWDFSWESTVGIDRIWSPPHTFNYLTMALAGLAALSLVTVSHRADQPWGIRLGRAELPLGGWLVLWSALAFATAVLFDRWWQSSYGLGAGIWHPPQMLKALSFFAVITGVWLLAQAARNADRGEQSAALMACGAGGLALALIHIITLTSSYPNEQHSASFYRLGCATYPIVLAALAASGQRWGATLGAVIYGAIMGAGVWLLPLFAAKPLVGPIYNQMDHLMPPPFPLLLVVPAIAMDLIMRKHLAPESRSASWIRAGVMGLAFFFCFLLVQWLFSIFLLSHSADNWFFAGGGKHWPFFLKIGPATRVRFLRDHSLNGVADELDGVSTLLALLFAVMAARLGLWLGAWMGRVQR